MEGSPVLCAKQLLGKGGTELRNAAFFTGAGSASTQMIDGGVVLLPGWFSAPQRGYSTVSLCVFYSLARLYAALRCHAAIVTKGLSFRAAKGHVFNLAGPVLGSSCPLCGSKWWRSLFG